MKRLITILLVLTLALCLVACGEDTATTPANTEPTTTVTQPTTTVAAYTYKIRVVDQDGNPIEGAYVQFCLDTCDFFATNADGWALINKPVADGYKAHIMYLPEGYEGYTFSSEDVYLEAGQTEMVLVATKPAA